MKVRYETRCGRCREWMNPGTEATLEFGTPWHRTCAALFIQARLVAAKGRTIST